MGVDTCYYDGRCGLCRVSVRWLRRLDWARRLAFVDMTSLRPEELPVAPEQADRGMPMRTASGRVLVGFDAVRHALARTPMGAPLAWVMYVPGVSWVGRRVYGMVARHRRRDVVCACLGGVGKAGRGGVDAGDD